MVIGKVLSRHVPILLVAWDDKHNNGIYNTTQTLRGLQYRGGMCIVTVIHGKTDWPSPEGTRRNDRIDLSLETVLQDTATSGSLVVS